MPKIIGYGICGAGEADRYLEATLKEFTRLCDETVICCNNATNKEKRLIKKYGFKIVEDNREWGTNQHLIKQDLLDNHIAKLNPYWCITLDMDEVFDKSFTREKLLELDKLGDALYVYIVNLWEKGYNPELSFWNVRAWKWLGDTKILKQPLHCGLSPEWAYKYGLYAPVMLLHYGLKEKSSRQAKIERYKKYDPSAKYKAMSYYNALKSDSYEEFNQKEKMKEVEEYFNKYKPINRKNMKVVKPSTKLIALRRKSDGLLIRVPEDQVQEHLQRDFELITKMPKVKEDKEVGIAPDEPSTKSTGLICLICNYEAKSKAGLAKHSKRHE